MAQSGGVASRPRIGCGTPMLHRLDLRGAEGAALRSALPRPQAAKEPPVAAVQAILADVPARVAGVPELVLCVPPNAEGNVAPEVLAAAALAGVDEVYRIGGAQAIGAMAYGTESIRAVDVIVGPGNIYVSVAKREVAGEGIV